MTTIVREYPRPPAPRRVVARRWIGALVALGVAAAWWASEYHGDPDPFALRLVGLVSVLRAVPPHSHVSGVQLNEPAWDSCDGDPQGFDDVTVMADFRSDQPAAVVVAQLTSALRPLGWRLDPPGDPQAPTWSTTVQGSPASLQVFEPDSSSPVWSMEAEVAPAVHALPC